ncbi:MAG: CotH kinase family protein [Salinivirgaceae bacterium]|jgi:hypothetical protein|nr:CotH kinase family protein [Salinivirgaceae bacterium]
MFFIQKAPLFASLNSINCIALKNTDTFKRIATIAFALTFSIFTNCFGQHIVINEFMSNNKTSIQDLDNDFSDWIELYNKSDYAINIANYKLSDDETDLEKWVFPHIVIPSKKYLLVFASGKNLLDTNELHANFKLSSNGETIYLSNALNIIIDQTQNNALSENEVCIRYPDGSNTWLTTSSFTPNSSNKTLNQLSFSSNAGFYSSPFTLNITSQFGDSIYYTLDGSLPINKSNLYSEPLYIKNKTSETNNISKIPTSTNQSGIAYKAWEAPRTNINKATTVRCVSFKNGVISSKIYTKTYFVFKNAENEYSMPVISLVIDDNQLFNNDSGIYVPGIHFDSNDSEWTGNFFKSGDLWERPVHIEYFENNGNLVFSQDAGIRIHGGKTRQAAQKSLRLYAREEYGTKNFNYQLLPQRPNEKYKRFLLRTTMGAWGGNTIIKDVFAHELIKDFDIEFQYYQPAIVFINGEYWGIHTLRDRIDQRYIEYTNGIDKDSVDLIGGSGHVIAGNNSDFIELMDYIEASDLSDNNAFAYVKTKIDVDNYIDYEIAELFLKNVDWPSNNIKLWKPQTNKGKWRWIFYDLDAGFGDFNYNMLNHSTKNNEDVIWPNSPKSTLLFRKLLNNKEFEDKFISRFAQLLNNDFNKDIMLNKLDNVKKLYEKEISQHINRWNYPSSFYEWESDITENIVNFIENRPCFVVEHIKTFFGLSKFEFNCTPSSNITTNFIIAPNPNNGNFDILNKTNDNFSGTYKISDITGQIIYQDAYFSLEGMERESLNLYHVPSGIYILNISNGSNSYFERAKIVIVNNQK